MPKFGTQGHRRPATGFLLSRLSSYPPATQRTREGPKIALSVLLARMWHGYGQAEAVINGQNATNTTPIKKTIRWPSVGCQPMSRPSWRKSNELNAYKKRRKCGEDLDKLDTLKKGENRRNRRPIKKGLKRRESGENSDKSDTYKKGVEQARNRRKCDECDTHKKGVQRYGSATEQQPNRNGTATAEPGKNHGRNDPKVTPRLGSPPNRKVTTRVRPIITVSLR